jgi:hypothetical protein
MKILWASTFVALVAVDDKDELHATEKPSNSATNAIRMVRE